MYAGRLYNVSYPFKQWIIKKVIPHHAAIRANCKEGGDGSTKKVLTMKRKAELSAQISELESTKRQMISEIKPDHWRTTNRIQEEVAVLVDLVLEQNLADLQRSQSTSDGVGGHVSQIYYR